MKWQHIIPLNDLREHDDSWRPLRGSVCHCVPEFDWENKLIIHRAYDCREAVEEAEQILKEASSPKIECTKPQDQEPFCDCEVHGPCGKFCNCGCHNQRSK